MYKHEIISLGDPRLHQVSSPILADEFGSAELKMMVDSLFQMLMENPAVGIAAPQVGINKKIFVIGCESDPEHPRQPAVPFMAFINPEIVSLSDEQETDYETCLSLKDLIGRVPRPKQISYKAQDLMGNSFEGEASGYLARVIQHENDHLNGITFIERVTDKKSIGFLAEVIAAKSS